MNSLALSPQEMASLVLRGVVRFQPHARKPHGNTKHGLSYTRKYQTQKRKAWRDGLKSETTTCLGKPRKRQWVRCGNGGSKEYKRAYMARWRAKRKELGL